MNRRASKFGDSPLWQGPADDRRIADLSTGYDPVLAAVRPRWWLMGRKWRNETEIAAVLLNLKARRYRSLGDMAKQNERAQAWARWFVGVIVRERKLMSLEEFAACLTSPAAHARLLCPRPARPRWKTRAAKQQTDSPPVPFQLPPLDEEDEIPAYLLSGGDR